MNKFGTEHFDIQSIEECLEESGEERERYWIERYDSFKNGYNQTYGGKGKNYMDYEVAYSLWKEGKNLKEIATLMSCSPFCARKALNSFGVTNKQRKERAVVEKGRKVYMININTEEILKIFLSMEEAERFLGKNRGKQHIKSVCNGERKSAYGYKWSFV